MHNLLAFLFFIIAGAINGSFALPTKYMPNWKFENIWLFFGFWNFIILPWIAASIFAPQILHIYAATPPKLLWLLIIVGFSYGFGQISFALALEKIGFGLGFLVNLGLGISLGYLLPLLGQHSDKILTPFGLITFAGTTIAMIGLFIANKAGKLRNHEQSTLKGIVENENKKNNNYKFGILLAIVAGLVTATQNFAFSLTYDMQTIALNMGASSLGAATIIWPIYLTSCAIPSTIFYLFLHKKNNSFECYKQPQQFKYHLLALSMALLWYVPVMLFSLAAKMVGNLGPLVGWPMYLVLVILSSNFWGWKHKEWEHCSVKAKKIMRNALLTLIAAIVVLACGSI